MNPNTTTYYISYVQIRDLIKTGRMPVLKGSSLSDILYSSFHYTCLSGAPKQGKPLCGETTCSLV